MATQLGVVNDALSMIAERRLTSDEFTGLSGPSAREMSSAWPDAVDYCLSAAPWGFASRIEQLTAEGSDTGTEESYAAPGYSRAFPVPPSHLRTNWLRDIPDRQALPVPYAYQDGFWHTNTTSLYVSYVSHEFRPPETWTAMFAKVVAGYLAWTKGPIIRPAADEDSLRLKFQAFLDAAQTVDASEMPFTWHAPGRLVRSRQGFSGSLSGYRR